jgi:hypothetical protein
MGQQGGPADYLKNEEMKIIINGLGLQGVQIMELDQLLGERINKEVEIIAYIKAVKERIEMMGDGSAEMTTQMEAEVLNQLEKLGTLRTDAETAFLAILEPSQVANYDDGMKAALSELRETPEP